MGKLGKAAIILALVVAVAAVAALKSKKARQIAESQPTAPQPAAGLPRLVDLGSTTCVPCKMMAPMLEQLKEDYAGRLQVEFVDVVVNPQAAKPYGIKLIPTQIFFDASGKELFRHEGFFSREDILGKFREFNIPLAEPPSD